MKRKDRGRSADAQRFVQIAQRPSLGVEVSTGRPWIGVDQQVGHGSADALFALTDEQYVAALETGTIDGPFLAECWRGERNDLLLFHPSGGAWTPQRWLPARKRPIRPRFEGELWRHIDAIGEPADGEKTEVSRLLAAHTAMIETGPDGVQSMTFRLVGEGAYPRPGALIAGLNAGSDREQVRAILGAPVVPRGDVHGVEGFWVRLSYAEEALTEISLERQNSLRPPGGPIESMLDVLGTPEEGAAFQVVTRLGDGSNRRWAASSGSARRLIVFDHGVEMQVEDDRVLSVRLTVGPQSDEAVYRRVDDLIPGVTSPLTRDHLRRVLGTPVDSSGSTDLYRYGRRHLLVDYEATTEGEAASTITAVLAGVSLSHRFYRWRSGDFTRFLDILGRPAENDLVARVGELPGVRLIMNRGVVAAVDIGTNGYHAERFAAFVDGMPAQPSRKDIPFGVPAYTGDHDDVWDVSQGWVHAHVPDGTQVASIRVTKELPDRLAVHRWMPHRDRD